MHFSEF